MTLQELTARAVRIRSLYAGLETSKGKAPWTGEQLMQGFVVDVGELMELVMAKAGARSVENLEARLAHELADCLWSVLVLSDAHQIDLAAAFHRRMAEREEALGKAPAAGSTGSQEVADLLSRALTLRAPCAALEEARAGTEWTSEHLMEGLVVHVGDLMRLSLAKAGWETRTGAGGEGTIAEALADCLWSVLVLSDRSAVSLEKNFLETMTSLEQKIAQRARA